VPWVPEEFISGYQSRGLHLGPPGYEHGNWPISGECFV
jgi:hypothetical protein